MNCERDKDFCYSLKQPLFRVLETFIITSMITCLKRAQMSISQVIKANPGTFWNKLTGLGESGCIHIPCVSTIYRLKKIVYLCLILLFMQFNFS